MAEMSYFEKKRRINELLEVTKLEINCLNPSFNLVKKVSDIEKAIDFASSDIKNSRSVLKDVSLVIYEIGWTYYSKFSRIDFEDELIEKLENYLKENQKSKSF